MKKLMLYIVKTGTLQRIILFTNAILTIATIDTIASQQILLKVFKTFGWLRATTNGGITIGQGIIQNPWLRESLSLIAMFTVCGFVLSKPKALFRIIKFPYMLLKKIIRFWKPTAIFNIKRFHNHPIENYRIYAKIANLSEKSFISKDELSIKAIKMCKIIGVFCGMVVKRFYDVIELCLRSFISFLLIILTVNLAFVIALLTILVPVIFLNCISLSSIFLFSLFYNSGRYKIIIVLLCLANTYASLRLLSRNKNL